MKSIRILNLEQAEEESRRIRCALEKGFDLDWRRAADEAEFHSSLSSGPWDVIISGYKLPGLTGLEAFEMVNDAGLDVPFIIVSGTIDQDTAVAAMRLGVSDYLMKDDLERIVPTVTRAILETENRREKRSAEKALAESEDRLRLALKAAGIGAWELDIETGDAVWSPETSAIFGLTVAGSSSSVLSEMVVPEDLDYVRETIERAIAQRRSFDIRLKIRSRGNGIRWVASSGKCEYDERGEPARLVGTIRDITRDKQAEEALIEAEERYRVMAETAADGVISIDETCTILFVNPALEKMLGYKSEELIGKRSWELFSPEEAEIQKARMEEYLGSGKKTLDWTAVDATARRKDGTELIVEISFGEYRKGGKHVFTGFVRDITEFKRQKDALERSEHNFRALVQATTEYVWQLDERANLTEFPHWWVELTGQGYEESLKYGWVECVHPDDRVRVQTRYAAALANREPVSLELRIRSKDGSYRHYAANGVPVPGEDGGYRWICALRDITKQRIAEERYRLVSTMSADYMFAAKVGEDGVPKMDWVAGALEEITGRGEEYFRAGGTWRDILHPDDRETEDNDTNAVFEGKQVETELRVVRPDGSITWVCRLARPVWNDELGRITAIVGAVKDITEKKQAEIAVREREEYLRAVLNAEPQCVKVFNSRGEVLDINPAGVAMLEADREEDVLGTKIFRAVEPSDLGILRDSIQRSFSGETMNVNYRITGFKGTRRQMEMCTTPIRNPEGEITSVLGVSRDITERQRIEAALIESERQYSDLINTVEGIVWEVDIATMTFNFVSRQAEAILGYPVERWYEKGFWESKIHPEDRDWAINYCASETAKGEGHTFEYRMTAADGRLVFLRDIVSVVTDDDGKPVKLRGLMVDVTEQRRMDTAMKHQALLIEQAHEAIFAWDLERGVIEWNLGCERLYGYKREEVLGRFAYEVLKTRYPVPVEEVRDELLAKGVWKGEVTQTTSSGEHVLVDSRAQLIELDGRKVVLQTSRDITEMRRAENALRESEVRYRHLFENNPYPMWVYDVETLRFLAVNDSAVDHYGYSSEEFRAMKITDIRPSEDVGLVIERARRAGRHSDVTGQWRHVKKDGTVINVQITSHALEFEGKQARLVLANDITGRLRAERDLKRSEAKYRELVDNANDIIYTHDLKGRFTSLNHAGERIMGYTEREAKQLHLADVVAPEFMEQASEMIARKLAKDASTIYETELIAKDGRRIPLEVNSRLIYEDGKPVAVQGIARDFTERHKAEEELRIQRQRLDKTAEASPVAILSLRVAPDGTRSFPYISTASFRVFGFMPDDLRRTAEPVFSRVKPAYLPTIEHILSEALTSLAPVHAVYEYDHPNRGPVWVETYGAPTIDKDGSVIWHGIAADITEQKQAEAALIASEEQLRQSQKLESIGILAGGLAHDFNNMLTAINGYSELIIRKLPASDPIRKQVEEIKKAGERSAELTRQLLAFSRRQILQPTTLDLNGVVTDTSSLLKRLLGEDITITTELAHNLWKIKADQGQLTQVVMNLMINSRDAMPNGGSITIETANVKLDREHALTHPSSTPGPYVMLRITDTGVGMDDETRQRVFEPFFTTKPVGRGTGLGLSTVYGIVKQSGGNIWVDSEPGEGATFTIYLPQAAEEAERARSASEQSEPHSGSEKVLLVEDEASVRGLAKEILEACGYEVFEASNGREAIDRFERECSEIDLLITDIVMPGMSGRELSEKVASRCPHIKVLFTSGYTDDAIIRHGIVDQGKNFLQKPFTFDGLAQKVRAVLDESGKPVRVNGSKGMASKN